MTARQPAEWAPHDAVWIGFPSHADLWEDDLQPARDEVAAFARIIHAGGKGEEVRLVAADSDSAEIAKTLVPFATVIQEPFGDIWLRDTGPILLVHAYKINRAAGAGCIMALQRDLFAASFRFNGWGGKYQLEGDDTLGPRLAHTIDLDAKRFDWVLEGGAIDVDGTGLAVTTEQCLLNPNRNPDMDRAAIEAQLQADLGIDRLLWLGDGLANDHTDGHVDNLARFVAEGTLAIPEPAEDDPNAAVYADAKARAESFGLKVVPLPSPGTVERDGEIIPASYMNFYIGNAAVAVPVYGAPNDDAAVKAIAALFQGRHVEGYRADHILTGGGSFHCISQQVPR